MDKSEDLKIVDYDCHSLTESLQRPTSEEFYQRQYCDYEICNTKAAEFLQYSLEVAEIVSMWHISI